MSTNKADGHGRWAFKWVIQMQANQIIFVRKQWIAFAFTMMAAMSGSAALNAQESRNEAKSPSDEIQLPDIGIRMTPGLLKAISNRFAVEMKSNLDLDDQQTTDIEGIITQHLGKLANDNAVVGRDAIEKMMETMILNDGRFPKEEAVKFAKSIKPLLPAVRQYFTDTSTEIGKKLNFQQRLKFSAQMGAVMSGFSVFEQRMAKWEDGKVNDNANPFWDGNNNESENAGEPVDPNEHPDHRRARQDVERWVDWELRIDDQWDDYLKKASSFYEFDDAQKSSGENVMKQCKDRAALIKTPEWREKAKQNRIAKRLARRAGNDMGEGPIAFALDREYNKLRQPLQDLDAEFKRRVDELPTSKQRQAAKQKVRKFLAERHVRSTAMKKSK
ncbi:MAG: hypothetical protein IPK83_05800 [Planctomycetes bacterium]|nr:hypothetical protein [Planctomycetota bacterium]